MTVDEILVKIDGDMSGLRKDLDRIEKHTKQTTKRMEGSFAMLGAAVRGGVVAAVALAATRIGSHLGNVTASVEEMQAKSSVVFGRFVSGVREELDEFGESVGRSQFELEGMAASIQDTFVPLGFARGEAADLSVELTKLAVDVASFNNAADPEVMRAFQSAIVGNHETVRQFGIIITQANLQQELFNIGINKNIKDATEQEKVQARLSIITKGVSDAHGDAARTANSYANRNRKLLSAFNDLQVQLGTALLPVLTTVQDLLIGITNAANRFMEVINKKGGLSDSIRTTIQKALPEDMKSLLDPAKTAESFMIQIPEIQTEFMGLEELIKINKQLEDEYIALSKNVENFKDIDPMEGADNLLEETKLKLATVLPLLEKTDQALRTAKELGLDVEPSNVLKATVNEGVEDGKTKDKEVVDEDFIKRQEKLKEKVQDLRNEIALLKAEYSGSTEAQLQFMEAGQEFGKLADENLERLINERQALLDQIDAKNKEADIIEQLTNANNELSLEQSALADVERELIRLRREAGVVMFENEAEIRSLLEAQQALKDELEQQDDAYEKIGKTIEDSLGTAIEGLIAGTTNAKDAFRQMAASIMKDLIQLAFQMDKTSKAGQGGTGLGGFLKNIFGMGGGTVTGAGGVPWMTGGTSGVFGMPDALATGGSANRMTPYLVGERGPEIIIPKTAATVLNSNNTRSAMGGGGGTMVQQVFNISTGVQDTVRAEIQSMMPQFEQRAVTAVASAKARGGTIGRRL